MEVAGVVAAAALMQVAGVVVVILVIVAGTVGLAVGQLVALLVVRLVPAV
jgi:hypothetical protein